MLIDYLPLFIILILAIAVGLLILLIDKVFGPHRPTVVKGKPYESGMVPYGEGTRRMHVRYYLVAVLFILFDVEVIFFLPWAVSFKKLGIFAFIEMLIFVAILMVGFVYIWKKGALEWE
ncbi:NADH-quinone oxidoreductase subunit A [bacterium]|nr:NADH-quinone oxidoreductase subunit A [bacterium]